MSQRVRGARRQWMVRVALGGYFLADATVAAYRSLVVKYLGLKLLGSSVPKP